MGFTSWNAFAFEGLTQEKMEQTAAKMLKLGLCEYGYNYVNIDSGWQGTYGGPYDAIQPNEKFPDMKGFCERMHEKGLKCGIYSTPMLNAFGCSIKRKPLPRCNTDSIGNFQNLLEIYQTYFDYIEYINRGHYFDLDMLDIGESDLFEELGYTKEENFGYTEDEELMVYSTRAFFASPVQLSCHLDTLNDFQLSMLMNDEIIAINQDDLGRAARPCLILEKDGVLLHVWRRELSDGYAIAAFNFGNTTENTVISLDGMSHIRDVWAKEDLEDSDRIALSMPPHTVRIFKVHS